MVEERDGWRIKKNKNSPLIYKKKIKKRDVRIHADHDWSNSIEFSE